MVHRTISFACGGPLLTLRLRRVGIDHARRAVKRDPRRFDDLFEYFGRITVRSMFGGEGIYSGEQIIGLVIGDQIYLKTTDANRADYVAENCAPFSYRRGKKLTDTSYYAVPDRLLDDPEEFAEWVRKAQAAAIAHKAARKKPRSRKR